MKRIVGILVTALFWAVSLAAATDTWVANNGGNWSQPGNWSGDVAPLAGDSLYFADAFLCCNPSVLINNDFPANTVFESLAFVNRNTTFTAAGNTINLGAGGIYQGAATKLIDSIPFILIASQTWSTQSPGYVYLDSPASIGLGSNTLTITGSGTDAIFSTITGSGGITLDGPPCNAPCYDPDHIFNRPALTLTLGGGLSYTGLTSVGGRAALNLATAPPILTPITANSGAFLYPIVGNSILMNAPLTINADASYEVVINGTGPTQYSRIVVTSGPITLGGHLEIGNNVTAPVGSTFTIIQNQTGSAVAGTFAGLPEGATFTAGANTFRISYLGGSGHDVTLTTVAGPTMSEAFGTASVPVRGTTSLSFTITNPNPTSLSGIGFSDVLPAGLIVSTPNGVNGTCNGVPPSATAGSNAISLAGASLGGGGSCTFSVNITGSMAGVQTNTTSPVTSSEGGNGNAATASVVVTVSRADLNGDGRSDVLWRDVGRADSAAWLMNGTTIDVPSLLPTVNNVNWQICGSGDFDGDGKWDVIWLHPLTGQVVVWLMNGPVLSSAVVVTTLESTNWKVGGIGDFDGDRKSDVIWRNVVSGEVVVWLMNGATISIASFLPWMTDPDWNIAGVGDFNGDGIADVFWRNAVTGEDLVWLMDRNSVSAPAQIRALTSTTYSVVGMGDLDGDGTDDVVWWDHTTGDVAVWLMHGGDIGSAMIVQRVSDLNWHPEGIGDFDGDGKADLIWRNVSTGDVVVWLMDGVMLKQPAYVTRVNDTNWQIGAPR